MNSITIVKVSNGFVLTMHDADGNLIDQAIAGKYTTRGYAEDNLVTAIENLFEANTPKAVVPSAVYAEDTTMAELIKEATEEVL